MEWRSQTDDVLIAILRFLFNRVEAFALLDVEAGGLGCPYAAMQ